MKFLADMGISARTVSALREHGHDAVHAGDIGFVRASEETILECARADGRVVLTVDLDFGQLLAASLQATPSVVIFRVHDQTPGSITPRLLRVIAERTTDLEKGAIVLVEDSRYCVRTLPIKRRSPSRSLLGPCLRRQHCDGSGSFRYRVASAAVMAATSVSTSKESSCRRPLTKNVGVPFTPLRTPLRKSSRTRGAKWCSVKSRSNRGASR